jgi:hypothetical protein
MAILTTEGSSSPASQPIYTKTLRAKVYNYLFTVAFFAVNLFLVVVIVVYHQSLTPSKMRV